MESRGNINQEAEDMGEFIYGFQWQRK
jgi:hypothetical protein